MSLCVLFTRTGVSGLCTFLTFINHRTSSVNLPQDWGYYKRFTPSKFATRGVSANIPSTPFPAATAFHWLELLTKHSHIMRLERRCQGTIRQRNYLLRRYSLVQILPGPTQPICFLLSLSPSLHTRRQPGLNGYSNRFGLISMPPLICQRQRESSYVNSFFLSTNPSECTPQNLFGAEMS